MSRAKSPSTIARFVLPATVVGIHDPDQLAHLARLLEQNDPARQDVVLVAVHAGAPGEGEGEDAEQIVGDWETRVFTTAVAAAEDAGKPVALVGTSGKRPYRVVLEAAGCLQLQRVVFGASELGIGRQARQIRADWHDIGENRPVRLEILPDDGPATRIDLEPAVAAHG